MARIVIALIGALIISMSAVAQTDGETVWIRAFLDVNASGTLDPGEGLLTYGVSAALLNADGVTIATALLDESPNAAQGLIGFSGLAPGDYTIVIASPELSPTRGSSFNVTVTPDREIPLLIEYGGQPLSVQFAAPARRGVFGTALYIGEPEQVARTGTALLGALVITGIMIVLGFIIYLTVVRRRLRKQYRAELAAIYHVPPAARTSTIPAAPRS